MTSRIRQSVNRSIVLVAVAAAAGLALGGCKIQVGEDSPTAGGSPTPVAIASPSPSHSGAAQGSGGGKASGSPRASRSGSGNGNPPDACTLLSRAEVSSLTGGKSIAQVDTNSPGDTERYCQWQLSGARVLVALQPSTRAQFDTTSPEAKTVDGVGGPAYTLSGHLFVYVSGLSVDIYTSSGTDAAGELRLQKQIAAKVLPRL
jgi:hypothetical protein